MTKCITALAVCVALLSGCTNKPTVTSVRCKDGMSGTDDGAIYLETGIDLTFMPRGEAFHLVYTYWSDGTVTNNHDWFRTVRNTEANRRQLFLDIVGSC
jgi:hypothetical protein